VRDLVRYTYLTAKIRLRYHFSTAITDNFNISLNSLKKEELMKIWVQVPVTMPKDDPNAGRYFERAKKHFAMVKRPDTEVVMKDVGGAEWDSNWETFNGLRSFNYIEILKSILKAEKQGFDGVCISCFLDPALSEARQLLKIPVTGIAEASMHFASLMGARFAVITKDRNFVPPMEAQISRYGLEAKAIKHNPVRVLTIPESRLSPIEQGIFNGTSPDYSPLVENFVEVAKGCIEDGAEVLIMGCGLLSPVLMEAGLLNVDGAALVEPNHASLKLTEILVDLHKAGIPFVSRKSTYLDVPARYISEVLASRA
jgi:Asp/Glu/hydantoin racemase